MSYHRFFAQSDNAQDYRIGETVTLHLDDQDFHHATRVVRLRTGESIEVVLRDLWSTYRGEVVEIGKDALSVRITDQVPSTELPVLCDLFWGYAKGDKNEQIVRQTVEIGINRLVPVLFKRCEANTDPERGTRKVERLQKIACSAAMQAHRSVIPHVEAITSFDKACAQLFAYDVVIVAWEQAHRASFSKTVDRVLSKTAGFDKDDRHIALVIGPEGGIDPGEAQALWAQGAQLVSMGASILRVETACTVACGILADRIQASFARQRSA